MLFGLVFFPVVGAVIAVPGIVVQGRRLSLARTGQHAPGRVVDIRVQVHHHQNGTESRTSNPVVAFRTADGRDMSVEVEPGGWTAGSAGTHVGDQVGIVYDADNPDRAEIDTSAGRISSGALVAIALGLGLIIYGIAKYH